MRLALASAALAFASCPQFAAGQVSAPSATPDAADALAALVLPQDKVVAIRVPRFAASIADDLANDKRIAELDRKRPGLRAAVVAAMLDQAAASYRLVASRLQANVAGIYRSRLSAAEIAQLVRFFNTPTGQTLVSLSIESAGDSATEFYADRQRNARAMFQNPDARTKADLGILLANGLAAKVRTVGPEIAMLSRRRFDEVSTDLHAKLPARIDETIAAFVKDEGS